MFPEDDLLPISALQHLLFCPRQCALIHVERLWSENSLTLEGRHLHQRADSGKGESRPRGGGGVRIARGLMLRSLELGLYGKADVVEFRHAAAAAEPDDPTSASSLEPQAPISNGQSSIRSSHFQIGDRQSQIGNPTPFPIEYKRGKPKKNRCDEVQLCAQALCLEEMLGVNVPGGALFYGTTRRRVDVTFDEPLRVLTKRLIAQLREMVQTGITPPAVREKKCDRCSLLHLCLPEARPGSDAASRYLRRSLGQSLVAVPAGE